MSQCLQTAETMFQEPTLPPAILPGPSKRQAMAEPLGHISKRQAIGPSGEMPPFDTGTSSFPQIVPRPPLPRDVPVQPKPFSLSPSSIASTPLRNRAPRKRGRPRKAIQSTGQETSNPSILPAKAAPPLPVSDQTTQQARTVQGPPDQRLEKGWLGVMPQPAQELAAAEPVDIPADFKAEGGQSSN